MDGESSPSRPPGAGTEILGAGNPAQRELYGLPVLAELPLVERAPRPPKPVELKKRWRLGIILFLVTCASMWIAGSHAFVIAQWHNIYVPWLIKENLKSSDGPLFMFAMMSILFSHEMGHFLQSLRYRVSSSVPYFIPMPISPIGTMGAVIVMSGRNRNRKELFDIGLSGPWAGLIVALPMLYYGVLTANMVTPSTLEKARDVVHYPDCLLVQWMIAWLRPEVPVGRDLWMSPWLLAGWGATLLTGLNMLPVGQLDGGHTAYALFGKRAYWLARIVMMVAAIYIVTSGDYGWSLMFILVLLMRPEHPPTLDDAAPLGWPRWIFGFISLFIPVICLAPLPNL